MKQNDPDIPDFDDLLFESRNKEYGSYQLRKKYNSVVTAGILIASFIVCVSVILPFLLRPSTDEIITGRTRVSQMGPEKLESPEDMSYIPETHVPPELKNIQVTVKYVPPEVTDSILPSDKTMAITGQYSINTIDTFPNVKYSGIGGDLFQGEDGSSDDGSLFFVEVMPTFKGGDTQKFAEWVKRNMYYPTEAVENGISGTVVITFVIEKDGSVTDVSIVKGVHPLLDDEALKVISGSPRWSPGLQKGQPVRIRFIIPVNFSR
jgi:periplasmic protein TonB